ncbi:UDP-galactopyranose mutase, partial [Oscillatoria amoena NRMC-F 0135]|nr:UDP-galactopyranose mutase [Oscillatoria amoena NRMC-F 0135]
YFRTNSRRIIDYLSQFTQWHGVEYRIKSYTDGRYWSFPINLATFEELIGQSAIEEQFARWLEERRVPITNPKNSEEMILSRVGREFYEMFYQGYTRKFWRRDPRDLDASVCGRVPIRTNRDDRYLSEEFQALPKDGYTEMFKRMLDASPGVELQLDTDYRKLRGSVQFARMIYTGPVDEYFDCRLGKLPYRSLRFEPESFTPEQLARDERGQIAGKPGFWQPAMQVNYPGSEPFTRIVEIKHATGQQCENTTIVREYPADDGPGQEPYYPIPAPDAMRLYREYEALAAAEKNVSFVGRLATYRYYNMDQVVGMALTEFEKLKVLPPTSP